MERDIHTVLFPDPMGPITLSKILSKCLAEKRYVTHAIIWSCGATVHKMISVISEDILLMYLRRILSAISQAEAYEWLNRSMVHLASRIPFQKSLFNSSSRATAVSPVTSLHIVVAITTLGSTS